MPGEENPYAHLLLSHSAPISLWANATRSQKAWLPVSAGPPPGAHLQSRLEKGGVTGEVNGSYSAKWLPISTRISGRQDPTSAPIPLANLSAQRPSTHQAHPCLSSPVPAAFSAQNAFPPNTGIACSLSQNITSAAASFITTVYKNLTCSYPIHPWHILSPLWCLIFLHSTSL